MKRFLSVLIAMLLILCAFTACSTLNLNVESNSEDKSESQVDTNKQTDESDKSSGNENEGGNNSGSTDGGNENEGGNNSGSTDGGNENEGGNNSGSTDGGNENEGGNNSGDSTEDGNEEIPYVREGNYIYFGEYPQSIKSSSVTITTTVDSRGYFLGSDNAYYAKVVASPYDGTYKFSSNQTVTKGSEYYFKVEPIKWRILSESNGKAVLLCESIIDSSRYDDANNNYKNSEIRAWLNGSFYSKAFDELEAALIQTVSVDNTLATTGYSQNANVCENTNDNVYLLSYKDVTNSAYGFSANADDVNVSRMKKTSDYAIANGAYTSVSTQTAYNGNGMWMLRTPNDSYTHFIRECNDTGAVTDGGTNITNTFFGIVPAITITLK